MFPLQNNDHVAKMKLFISFAKTNRSKVNFLDLHQNNAFKNTQTLISVCAKNLLQQAYQSSKIFVWLSSLFKFFAFQDFPGVSRRETLSGALLIHGNPGRHGILIMEIA